MVLRTGKTRDKRQVSGPRRIRSMITVFYGLWAPVEVLTTAVCCPSAARCLWASPRADVGGDEAVRVMSYETTGVRGFALCLPLSGYGRR